MLLDSDFGVDNISSHLGWRTVERTGLAQRPTSGFYLETTRSEDRDGGEVISMAFSEEHLFRGSLSGIRDNPAMQTAILDASHRIAMIYAGLLEAGFSEQMVANAMLGATIHFYDAAGIGEDIPTLLRQKADLIEREFRIGGGGAH